MTKSELNEIMDKSNFYIDSNNPYDMKILEILYEQLYNCENCQYSGGIGNLYCSWYNSYLAAPDYCCENWRFRHETIKI